jgi:hypothetical protein
MSGIIIVPIPTPLRRKKSRRFNDASFLEFLKAKEVSAS